MEKWLNQDKQVRKFFRDLLSDCVKQKHVLRHDDDKLMTSKFLTTSAMLVEQLTKSVSMM